MLTPVDALPAKNRIRQCIWRHVFPLFIARSSFFFHIQLKFPALAVLSFLQSLSRLYFVTMKPMPRVTKRKEAPNPLLGTLTRSKSQIYSHLNRSGCHRSDAFALEHSRHRLRRHPGAQIDVSYSCQRRLKSSLPTAGEDASEGSVSPFCIKDLRSRRVFSEPLVVSEQEEMNSILSGSIEQLGGEVKPSSKFAVIDSLEEKFLSNGDSITTFGEELTSSRPDGEGEKADIGVHCIGEECGENPNSSRSMGMFSEEKDGEIIEFGQGEERLGPQKVDSSCNSQGLDDLSPVISEPNQIIDEENVQTNPPDPDIFSLQKDEENRLNGGRDVLQAQDNYTGMHLNGTPNKTIDSIPRRKLVLNPCRLKVFKTPSSVSYRRLLPYLLDIAKENSKSHRCPNSEIVLEENPTVRSPVSLKPILHTASFLEKFPSDLQTCNSTDPVPSMPNSMDCSYTTKPTAVTTDIQNKRPSPSNSPRQESSLVDQVSSPKRLKVFKTPSSVSYRRLLPFLKAVAKNKSCELEIKSCPKLETVLEENPTVPLAHPSCIHMPAVEDGTSKSVLHTASQEMSTEGGSKEKFPCSMQLGDSAKHILNNLTNVDCPAENTSPTTIKESQNEMRIPTNSPQGDLSLVDQLSSAKPEEINISPTLVSDLTVCVTDSTSKAPHSYNYRDQTTTINALEDAITVYQSASPSNTLPCSELFTVSSAKGILKRNPRGCRGLCTCLSCASFRLHAERAFEFSRNQLQDTEEIVMELMKELSQVRTVLEMAFDDSNNSQGRSKIDKFEEVYASASKAEEIARNRLKEMNQELFFHCRMKCLQRPRVNFAIDIEDKDFRRGKPIAMAAVAELDLKLKSPSLFVVNGIPNLLSGGIIF
ncbi:hypothetical protein V2J09_017807 [Rumex salicifolius]